MYSKRFIVTNILSLLIVRYTFVLTSWFYKAEKVWEGGTDCIEYLAIHINIQALFEFCFKKGNALMHYQLIATKIKIPIQYACTLVR